MKPRMVSLQMKTAKNIKKCKKCGKELGDKVMALLEGKIEKFECECVNTA